MTTKHETPPQPHSLAPHRLPTRIYYEDTDAGGIVYHSNYLKFAERGRTEFLRTLGYDHHQVMADHGIQMVVRHAEIDYRASARLDDMLTITTEVIEFGNSSITMRQIAYLGEKVLADMKIVLVAVSAIGKAARIPPQLRQIFGK